MEQFRNFAPAEEHTPSFHGDELSFSEFRDVQDRILAEHRKSIAERGASGVEYELHHLYDKNPGAFRHWLSSLDGEGK